MIAPSGGPSAGATSESRRGSAGVEVRQVMRPGVVVIPEDASVSEARRAMQSHGVHAVLVVERSHGRPLGLVTPRKLLDWIDEDEAAAYAREAIGQAAVWIQPTATVREAAQLLLDPHISHLLVRRTDEEMPEGVVTARDLLPCDESPAPRP